MAVRPWENRFLDINLRDGVMLLENGSADGKNGTPTQLKPAGKKPISSNLYSNLPNEKMGPSQSDGCASSPSKSTSIQEASATMSTKPKSKPVLEDLVEEATSRPGVGSRSHSNPKERATISDKQGKKRFSLPSSGQLLSLSFLVVSSQSDLLFLAQMSVGLRILFTGPTCRMFDMGNLEVPTLLILVCCLAEVMTKI